MSPTAVRHADSVNPICPCEVISWKRAPDMERRAMHPMSRLYPPLSGKGHPIRKTYSPYRKICESYFEIIDWICT
jgi:hypothetical protein